MRPTKFYEHIQRTSDSKIIQIFQQGI